MADRTPRSLRSDRGGPHPNKESIMSVTVPTSVRLRPTEIEALRDAAAFSGISISDVARRALVIYLGIGAPDIKRQDVAALVTELGRLRADLARAGNLLKLAATNGRPAMAETERAIQDALAGLKVAITAVIGSAQP